MNHSSVQPSHQRLILDSLRLRQSQANLTPRPCQIFLQLVPSLERLMPTPRAELTLVVLLLVVASFAQTAKASSITLGAVTSFGEPLPGGKVLIEGPGLHKEVIIKGRAT